MALSDAENSESIDKEETQILNDDPNICRKGKKNI